MGPFPSMIESPNTPLLLRSCVFGFESSRPYRYKEMFWSIRRHDLESFPNLRPVDWAGAGAYDLPTHAPFHQLTQVETDFERRMFVRVPPNEELSILTISLLSKIGAPLLRLQHLRFLTIRSRSGPACFLFSIITCPSLQRLEINHNSLTEDQPYQNLLGLIRFLQRSTCQL